MKLSTRTRYGMRALLELALAYKAVPLQIKVIAERQNISNKYLEQLVAMLKTAGLVRSIRGPHGGYLLAAAPGDIKLSDVFRTLEGPVLTVECVEYENTCPNHADCATRKLWIQMNDAILGVLENKTLQDLVAMAEKEKQGMSYQI
ncbi:MAG: Rrf2 family transcriptional regulator [Planctomycetes bacterium]|nr:Rrf2 family transcriptional regulator [Planctomycetota bacterium]MBU1518266.1 Rrf2 family transcriptional regulator [Planctomycetota bacterium]MBU2457019.1 Rrf2 family transcriptional regulator [Planctomycetota bacterium]MBU2596424.1 Rrf2 family transcriptional regulator [Planctomycetota bacterium]